MTRRLIGLVYTDSKCRDVSDHRTSVPTYPPRTLKASSRTHLLHEGRLRVCWVTASNAAVDFGGCDDEHSQAHCRPGVRLSNPAGGGAGCAREGGCGGGLLLHRTRRNPGMWVGSGLAGIDGLQAW